MLHVMEVTAADRAALEKLAGSQVEPYRRVVQARALLLLAEGVSLRETARRMGSWPRTVARWRDRFGAEGVEGLGVIASGRGRKPRIPAETVEAIVYDTLHTRPDDESTHWTTRLMADRHGVGKDTVARIWRARNLKPWLTETS
jgi:transposase